MSFELPPKDFPSDNSMSDAGASGFSGKAIASLIFGLLSFCLTFIAGIPAIIFGAWALNDISRSRGQISGQAVAIIGTVFGCLGTLLSCLIPVVLLPAVQAAREAARRQVTSNNMKQMRPAATSEHHLLQIGLAMHNYHDVYKRLPLAGSNDPQHGIRMSWRVRLLPFVEHGQLYQQINSNVPWDHPQNKPFSSQMPKLYMSPNYSGDNSKTVYLVPVSDDPDLPQEKQAMFSTFPPFAPNFAQVTDGNANTIMVVEVDGDQAVIWTAPEDWKFDPQNPKRGLRKSGGPTLFSDGSVRSISPQVSDEVMRGLMTRSGGESVGAESISQ